MSTPVRFTLLVLVALGAGCTSTSSVPATTPTIPATTSSITPGSVATTTTSAATTTTIDRVSEIEAILQDLERRRLQAILDQDEEAFRALFANEDYLELSLVTMDLVSVVDPLSAVIVDAGVFEDSDTCLGITATWDLSEAIEGGGIGTDDYVLEPMQDGWGFSWVGEGWRCDGPHPLSG